jgi:hypothetical protein
MRSTLASALASVSASVCGLVCTSAAAPAVMIAGSLALASALGACSAKEAADNGFDAGGGGDRGSVGDDGGGGGLDEGPRGAFEGESPRGGACKPDPSQFDVPGNNCDDDGDGTIDNGALCDESLPLTGDARQFARAMGLCRDASNGGWGLVSATYTKGRGTGVPSDSQHGILGRFGDVIRPRQGGAFGVLSTGWAREYNAPNGTNGFKDDWREMQRGAQTGAPPPGFPRPATGCTISDVIRDVVGVRLEVKVPSNATGMAYDFNFWTAEWPEYVCSDYNDAFVAILRSSAFNGGTADNISFDAQGNPVSVNNGFFDRCVPNTRTGCAGDVPGLATCPGGVAELAGTGYATARRTRQDTCPPPVSGGGATGWLSSRAPVAPGETIVIEFIIWDTGDERLDSSVLLDNFRWETGEVKVVTERPR